MLALQLVVSTVSGRTNGIYTGLWQQYQEKLAKALRQKYNR